MYALNTIRIEEFEKRIRETPCAAFSYKYDTRQILKIESSLIRTALNADPRYVDMYREETSKKIMDEVSGALTEAGYFSLDDLPEDIREVVQEKLIGKKESIRRKMFWAGYNGTVKRNMFSVPRNKNGIYIDNTPKEQQVPILKEKPTATIVAPKPQVNKECRLSPKEIEIISNYDFGKSGKTANIGEFLTFRSRIRNLDWDYNKFQDRARYLRGKKTIAELANIAQDKGGEFLGLWRAECEKRGLNPYPSFARAV